MQYLRYSTGSSSTIIVVVPKSNLYDLDQNKVHILWLSQAHLFCHIPMGVLSVMNISTLVSKRGIMKNEKLFSLSIKKIISIFSSGVFN